MLPFKRGKADRVEDGDGYVPKSSSYPMKSQEESIAALQVFGLDLRSLACFRLVTGLILLVDILSRSRHLFAHYASLGVWPVTEAINNVNAHSFSLLFTNGNMPFLVLFFIFLFSVNLLFLIGYKTRITTVVLWILVTSLHNRNVLVLNSGDDLLRIMLFWGMFLPLGERYSVDVATRNESTPYMSNRYVSLASFSFIAQIFAVYWVGYMLKTGIEWEEGTAMYYLFSVDQYTTPFGYFMLRFPTLLKLLTHIYIWFELLMPIMLIVPLSNGIVRTAACLSSFGIFSLLAICLELGLFPYAMMLASVALLPAWFWENLLVYISSMISPNNSRYWNMGGSLTIYYSPGPYLYATKFCLQLANTFLGLNSPILAADKQTQNRPEMSDENSVENAAAGDIERLLASNNLSWVVVDGGGKRHTGHRAAIALVSEVPFLAPLAPILLKMEKLVAFVYNFYAFIFSLPSMQHTLACQVAPLSVPPRTRRTGRRVKISDLVAVGFLMYILWWNVGTVNSDYQVPQGMQWLGMFLRVDQWWSMFAPYPMKDDGWFVIAGKLANGKELDLFKPGGGQLSYDKPTFVSRTFPDSRWRRFLMNIWSASHQDKRLFYGRYLCRQWNWYGRGSSDHDYLLKTFKIIYLREITLPNYKIKGPEPIVLWEHQC